MSALFRIKSPFTDIITYRSFNSIVAIFYCQRTILLVIMTQSQSRRLKKQFKLIHPFILFLLVLYVFSDFFIIFAAC